MIARREVVSALLQNRGDDLVVAGLGSAAWDVTAAGDTPLNFPMWGGMGGTAMVGLGLALAQPTRRVWVFTGDGDMLMGIGSLATIAVQRPANLRLVILDNGRYGETGGQLSHTAHGVDLMAVARGCGFTNVFTAQTLPDVHTLRETLRNISELALALIPIAFDAPPKILPPRDGAHLQQRFRQAVLGDEAMRE